MITLPADASSHRHRKSQCLRRSAVYDQQVCRTSRRGVRIGTCRICTVSLSWRSMLHVIGANNLTPPQIRARGCIQAHHTRRRPPSPSNITDFASQPHADPKSALDRSRGRRSADRVRLSSLVRSKGPGGATLPAFLRTEETLLRQQARDAPVDKTVTAVFASCVSDRCCCSRRT